MDVKTIVIYVVILAILWFALKSETADISCSAPGPEGVCGSGKGRAYYFAHPEKNDTREELLSKLVKTAKYDLTSVHWRRAMVVAIVTGFLSQYITEQKFPSAKRVALASLVIFLIAYAAQMQYQSSVVLPATKQAEEIATLLA
jgi:hypothetical protein